MFGILFRNPDVHRAEALNFPIQSGNLEVYDMRYANFLRYPNSYIEKNMYKKHPLAISLNYVIIITNLMR